MTSPTASEPAPVDRERRYYSLFEHNWDTVFSVDRLGNFTEANPAAERLTGYTRDELVEMNFAQVVAPEDFRRMRTELAKGLAGDTAPQETVIVRKDGARRNVVVATIPIKLGDEVVGLFGTSRDITDQKRAEAALRDSEARARELANVVERSTQAFAAGYANGRLRRCNRAFCELVGYTEAELERLDWAIDLTPPAWRGLEAEQLAQLAHGTDAVRYEKEYVRKNGQRVPVELVVNVVRDAAGTVLSYYGFITDLTVRKQAEAALRESEERYRLMVDAMPVLAWRCDAAGLCVDCNERWHEYTGQTPAEVRGNGWMAALHPDDRSRTLQKVKDDVAGGMIFQTEYRLRRATDNTYRWHLVRALPVKDATGQIMAWFGCAADIEDAKQAEQILLRSHQELDELVRGRTLELETTNRTLRESELRFRSLAEEIPAVTYITATGQTAGTQYVSPQIQEMLGISAAEFVADPDLWFTIVHPEDRPRVWAAVERLRQHGELLDLEYRVAHRNGKIVWVRDRAALMRDAAKRPLVQQGVLMDITRRKELEQQVLAISEREQRRIAEDLHDGLCQHLSGLAFMAEALERQLTGQKSLAAKQAHRLAGLLDDAVTQARRTARGLFPVNMEAGGLREALRDLAGHVQEMFGTRCRLRCPQPVEVRDQTAALHLYRIAQEAVSNAMRHGKPSQITISLTQRAGQVQLTVRDNGRGLPKRRRATTGMGLAVMEHRARVIGATFAVANARPCGTVVTCRLPLPHKKEGRS
jgi:PAS domain S-box-containing protein